MLAALSRRKCCAVQVCFVSEGAKRRATAGGILAPKDVAQHAHHVQRLVDAFLPVKYTAAKLCATLVCKHGIIPISLDLFQDRATLVSLL